jgi:Tfp pilus assembly protein PilV
MIDTSFSTPSSGDRPKFASQDGFLLIEVMISALLVALIAVAMFNGFDSTSRATASERARAQADALAQQAEDELRGEPISTLTTLESKPRVETVVQNGMTYTITSTAEYRSDSTATSSCNSSVASADYLQTTSKVTWPSLGVRKPVSESSIISPPPGTALIAQVLNASAAGVSGASVTATGPSPATTPHTLETSTSGCAILALAPGSYNINVSKTGYVDENGFTKSEEDESSTQSDYLVAENATKVPFRFAPAGEVLVSFENPSNKSAVKGDAFLTFNTGMTSPKFKAYGTLGTFATSISSTKQLFPFTSGYTTYAGSCPADEPKLNGGTDPTAKTVPAEGRAEVTVPEPTVNVLVKSGTEAKAGKEGSAINKAVGTLVDTGCEKESITAKRSFETTSEGKLPNPNLPYGSYSLCVTATIESKSRKFTTTFKNNKPAGVTVPTIYLGAGELAAGCP